MELFEAKNENIQNNISSIFEQNLIHRRWTKNVYILAAEDIILKRLGVDKIPRLNSFSRVSQFQPSRALCSRISPTLEHHLAQVEI